MELVVTTSEVLPVSCEDTTPVGSTPGVAGRTGPSGTPGPAAETATGSAGSALYDDGRASRPTMTDFRLRRFSISHPLRPAPPDGGLPRLHIGRRRAAGATGAVLGGIGVVLLVLGLHVSAASLVPAETSAPAVPATPGADVPEQPNAPPRGAPPVASAPVHLDIPRIEVHSDLIALGLNPDGTVAVPPTDPHAPAGWYQYLASPGEPGPAILLGHVDTYEGPAVFYRLNQLKPADNIFVGLADGRTAVFAVESVGTYPKRSFPTEAVYGQTPEPVLRLITCGGTFDRSRRTYLSNVVVYATLVTRY